MYKDPLVDISDGMPPVSLTHAPHSSAEAAGGGRGADGAPSATDNHDGASLHPRLQAVIVVGRYHGLELDPADYKNRDESPDTFRRLAVSLGAGSGVVVARGAAALAQPAGAPGDRVRSSCC